MTARSRRRNQQQDLPPGTQFLVDQGLLDDQGAVVSALTGGGQTMADPQTGEQVALQTGMGVVPSGVIGTLGRASLSGLGHAASRGGNILRQAFTRAQQHAPNIAHAGTGAWARGGAATAAGTAGAGAGAGVTGLSGGGGDQQERRTVETPRQAGTPARGGPTAATTPDPQMTGWEHRATSDPDQFARVAAEQQGMRQDEAMPTQDDLLSQMLAQQQEQAQQLQQGISDAYGAQIDAVLGQAPIMEQMAGHAQQQIGGFFDYAAEAAHGAQAPIAAAHETARGGVQEAYGAAQERVAGLPQAAADRAREAGGGTMGGRTAERVAAAAAPFEAALASGEAAGLSNLAQTEAAGTQYLDQLAAAAPQEAAGHQATVQHGLQQQLQEIQMEAARLEGAKQRAMLEASADASGDVFDRMIRLQQLGMQQESHDLAMAQGTMELEQMQATGGVDPMDAMRQESMARDLYDPRAQDPRSGFEMALQGMDPHGAQVVEQLGQFLTAPPDAETAQDVLGLDRDAAAQFQHADLGEQVQLLADPEVWRRTEFGDAIGLERGELVGRAQPEEVRQALQILAGMYS